MKRKEPRARPPKVKRYGPAEEAVPGEYAPGDFILTHSHGLFGRLIRIGESLRYWGADAKYARWNHAAMIVSADGRLIEALSQGVVRSHISKYKSTEYVVVHLNDEDADDRDRQQAVAYAGYCVREKEGYGWLTICNIGLALLTGCKFTFGVDGQVICSGLVARCLERTSVIFDGAASNVSPADLAKQFHVAAAEARSFS
ncbi:MAG TPA: hypothetical protein VIC29_16640 [Steroidobacteraceae bacterium]|jgi:uncharacterized protein YycO